MRTIRKRISRTGRCLGLLLALYLALAPTFFVEARGIGEAEVRAAVETWVRYVTADARPDAVIERMEPHKVEGETVAYIAHLAGGGFCLCGADELVLPVYYYNPQGTYDPQNPNYQYILWEIGTRLENLQKALEERDPRLQQYQEALSERASFWQELIAGRIPRRVEGPEAPLAEPVQMELNLTSHWKQGSPYNDQCPELTPGADEHTAVGCVATAMAQIMYYWKWPNTGVGDDDVDYDYRWRSTWDEEPLANNPKPDWGDPWSWRGGRLEWTSASGGRLRMNGYWDQSLYGGAQGISVDPDYLNALQALWNRLTLASTNYYANFGTTNYNWSIMEDTHTDPLDAGDAEVAKLCHHAGIAVGMTYGVSGSGASTSHVVDALEGNFRYDHDATYGARNIDTMTEEIQWLRPIQFRGQDYQGGYRGHAWVIYGYNKGTDPNRQFLMNMGWGGGGDGWYACDNIDYNHDGNIDFWDNQHHVTRIAPLNVAKFVGDDDPGDGSPDDPYEDIEEAIAEAPDDATLIFKAGSVNTFSAGTLIIDRPFTLKGRDVTIRKE